MAVVSSVTERKFALRRVSAGDYILPSNDGKTLWRITEYDEDGSAQVSADGKAWRPLRGKFWMTWRYTGWFQDGQVKPDEVLDWMYWEAVDSGLIKRKYAVEAVLNRG